MKLDYRTRQMLRRLISDARKAALPAPNSGPRLGRREAAEVKKSG